MRACPAGYARIVRFSLALSGMLSYASAFAQPNSGQKYVISVGNSSEKVASGKIWLYSYSWYGLQRAQLAAIENGVASLPPDTAKLKRELNPHPNTEGYVVALQLGEHSWCRTPDISPEVLWNDLAAAVNSLGRATRVSAGETELILPPLTNRHITLLYPDGRPAASANFETSIYLWDRNHCGFHEGLPLGTLRTDKTGTMEVLAPLVPLYFDGVSYFEENGEGPAGVAYSANTGLKAGAEANLVLRKKWNLTEEDELFDDVDVRVLNGNGRPRKDVDVFGNWATNTCGGFGTIGRTDAKGAARIRIDPSFTKLKLTIGGPYGADDPAAEGKSRDFTDAELRELFAKHKITIRW